MHQQLKESLWAYIVHNNPELMFNLQEEYSVTRYLEDKVSSVMPKVLQLLEQDKPGHVILELCMEELTNDLKPSKYHYIKKVLKQEFGLFYERFKEEGILTYEAINLIEHCEPIFKELSFCRDNEDNELIWAGVTGATAEYLRQFHSQS
ncbi:hypothetical protein [Sphingobacterium multivorum]|uniref:hypothetical protein n=1 Tax=Sphingobacterium multivorum TaxID=28454 RepID=UPI0028A65DE3|nr:hypothetical protein [Sphingobacterium multivorum]